MGSGPLLRTVQVMVAPSPSALVAGPSTEMTWRSPCGAGVKVTSTASETLELLSLFQVFLNWVKQCSINKGGVYCQLHEGVVCECA